MGYSSSPATINRVKPLLEQMLKADTNLSWPAVNAHMLGYHIREAMRVAEKDSKSPYKGLKEKFIIRNKGTHVLAELRVTVDIEAQIKSMRQRMVIESVTSLVEVVGAVITHEAHEMFFPDATLSEQDVGKLYEWAGQREYFLVVGEGITVTKEDPGEAKWTPE